MILKKCYPAAVVYVRTRLPFHDGSIYDYLGYARHRIHTKPATESRGTYHLDFKNPRPELLLVSKQVRPESIAAILSSCVLDIWGSFIDRSLSDYLPSVARYVKDVTLTLERCVEMKDCLSKFVALETLFVDGVHDTAEDFVDKYEAALRKNFQKLRLHNNRDRVFFELMQILLSDTSKAARKRPLQVYLRCTTFKEETILLLTELNAPPNICHGDVPQFPHKFPK